MGGPEDSPLRLHLNENPGACSPRVISALRRIGRREAGRYPDYRKFQQALAAFLDLPEDYVLLTNGGGEALRLACDTFLRPGLEAILPVPAFSLVPQLLANTGARVREFPWPPAASFPTGAALERISDKTGLVLLTSPANPGGGSIPEPDLRRLLSACRPVPLLLDETYAWFSSGPRVKLCRENDHLLSVISFSKVFGLAGLRLGALIGAPARLEQISRRALPFAVSTPALLAGLAALADRDWLEKALKRLQGEKEYLARGLAGLNLESLAADGNFLLFRAPGASALCRRLAARGILLRDLADFPLMDGWLRVSPGRRRENRALLTALKQELEPEALLFDMDGVLVEVSASCRRAIRETVAFFSGHRLSADEIDARRRDPQLNNDWDLAAALLGDLGRQIGRPELIARFQSFYWGENGSGFIRDEKWLMPKELLLQLKQRYQLALVTGRPRAEMEYSLARHGFAGLFDCTVSLDETGEKRAKPSPYGIRLALKKLGRRRALYFGDSSADMLAATRAGVLPVGVWNGQGDPAEQQSLLKSLGAQNFLKDISQINEVLT